MGIELPLPVTYLHLFIYTSALIIDSLAGAFCVHVLLTRCPATEDFHLEVFTNPEL